MPIVISKFGYLSHSSRQTKDKKRNYCQGRPGYALPLHLQKDQLLECGASQGPLSQSNPAGAIQSPGEEFSCAEILNYDYASSPKGLNKSGRGVALFFGKRSSLPYHTNPKRRFFQLLRSQRRARRAFLCSKKLCSIKELTEKNYRE